MLNIINIQGRFTADPEIKRTNSGDFCAFTLASQRGKDKAGNMITDFAPCMAWGKTGEFIKNHFRKGDQVIITGRFQSRNYKAQDGKNRTAYDIYVLQAEFCGDARKSATAAPVAAHCSTRQSMQADYDAINWDEIPDLPETF